MNAPRPRPQCKNRFSGQRDTFSGLPQAPRVRAVAVPLSGRKVGSSTETVSPETSQNLQLRTLTGEEAAPQRELPGDLRHLCRLVWGTGLGARLPGHRFHHFLTVWPQAIELTSLCHGFLPWKKKKQDYWSLPHSVVVRLRLVSTCKGLRGTAKR